MIKLPYIKPYTVLCIEQLNDARTRLIEFFAIPLERLGWMDEITLESDLLRREFGKVNDEKSYAEPDHQARGPTAPDPPDS